ncbi:MAG: sugar phosphate isomerase/epimerase [Oscillospiraceae bacterium]
MKKAIQLYAVRTCSDTDLEQTLRDVHQIGYEGVEFAGGGVYGKPPEEVRSWLKKYDLEIAGMHANADQICENADEIIEISHIIGNSRVIVCWHNPKSREDIYALADRLSAVIGKYAANGIKLGYHNHTQEFEKDNGEFLLDILLKTLPADQFLLEPDVYWVYMGKQDPLSYIKPYASRIECFHFKDGNDTNSTLAGEGDVDLQGIVDFAEASGTAWAIVESEGGEDAADQLEAAKKDFDYLSKLMKK